jgi:hypothetical protein
MKHWRTWGRFVTSAAASAAIAYIAFVANRPVPILDWFDLGIHEAGHLIAAPLPELYMFMAGSFAQVAFPLGMAFYFGVRRRDAASGGFCLAWAGTSAWDVSVYVADAPVQALPLVGGGQHDWAHILGHYDAIARADEIAGWVESAGAGLAFLGIAVALLAIARTDRKRHRPVHHRPGPQTTDLPVREVRTYEADPEAMAAADQAAAAAAETAPMPEDPVPAEPVGGGLDEDLAGDPWLTDAAVGEPGDGASLT